MAAQYPKSKLCLSGGASLHDRAPEVADGIRPGGPTFIFVVARFDTSLEICFEAIMLD